MPKNANIGERVRVLEVVPDELPIPAELPLPEEETVEELEGV